MPSRQFVAPFGTPSAPAEWDISYGLDLLVRTAYASYDGSAAAGAFLPCLRLISDSGHVAVEAVADTEVAAGGSANVSWFRGGGVGSGGGSGLASVVVGYGILSPNSGPSVPAGGSSLVSFGTTHTSDATLLAWTAPDTLAFKAPVDGTAQVIASCTWPAGVKIDCRIFSPDGFDVLHDGFDSISGYDATATSNGGPQLMDVTTMIGIVANADVPIHVRLTNGDAGASAPTDVQLAVVFYPGVS